MNTSAKLVKSPQIGSKFGYDINNSEQAINLALKNAQSLVQNAKTIGLTVRRWSDKAVHDISLLKTQIKEIFRIRAINKTPSKDLDKFIFHVTFWENETSRMVRQYFNEVSNVSTQLKRMNPPLSTGQIEAYVNTLQNDRKLTIGVLEKVTSLLHELADYKLKLYQASSKISSFTPAP